MGFDDIGELAAAARARNEGRKAARNAALTAPLLDRIAELEAENAALKAKLNPAGETRPGASAPAKKRGK